MKVEVKPNQEDPSSYDLFVNGDRKVEAESMVVVSNIETALVSPHLTNFTEYSEANEIANRIMRRKVS